MRIVYCMYSLTGGGIERVTTTKANYWAEKGHEVIILTTDYNGTKPFYPLDNRIKVINFPIGYTSDFNKSLWQRFVQTIRKMRVHYKQMKAFVEEYKPDVIVTTYLVVTAFLPLLRDKSLKIQELHNSYYIYRYFRPIRKFSLSYFLVRLYEVRNALFMKFFDAVTSLTYKDLLLRGKPSNMRVIYNPIHFNSDETAKLENKRVLALGRFTEQKDFLSLLDIWGKVIKNYPDWHLTIAGDGYLKNDLKNQIENLGISSSVTLLDEQKDVERLYLESSIYAMTSRFEGLPMVLLEAQGMGLPIISYDCPCGPSDIISDGEDGFLVKANDKDTFAKRLVQLMQDENLRKQMGVKAKVASKRFEVDTIMPQWEDLFNKLMREKNGK